MGTVLLFHLCLTGTVCRITVHLFRSWSNTIWTPVERGGVCAVTWSRTGSTATCYSTLAPWWPVTKTSVNLRKKIKWKGFQTLLLSFARHLTFLYNVTPENSKCYVLFYIVTHESSLKRFINIRYIAKFCLSSEEVGYKEFAFVLLLFAVKEHDVNNAI